MEEREARLQHLSAESECLRCAREKHIPKFYSSANNINPGFSIHFVQTTISLQ